MPRKIQLNIEEGGLSQEPLTEISATPIINSLITTNNLKYDSDWELIEEKYYEGGTDLGFKSFVFDREKYLGTYEYKLVVVNPATMFTSSNSKASSIIWWSSTDNNQVVWSSDAVANYSMQASYYKPLQAGTNSDPVLVQRANSSGGYNSLGNNQTIIPKYMEDNNQYIEVPWSLELTFNLRKVALGTNSYNYLRYKYREYPSRTDGQYINEGYFSNFATNQTDSHRYFKIGSANNQNFYSTNMYPMGYKIYRRTM